MKCPLTKERVSSPIEALAWVTECTLATIDSLTMRSKPPKGELSRQVSIASNGIKWLMTMGFHSDLCCMRVDQVISEFAGDAEAWAMRHKPGSDS